MSKIPKKRLKTLLKKLYSHRPKIVGWMRGVTRTEESIVLALRKKVIEFFFVTIFFVEKEYIYI